MQRPAHRLPPSFNTKVDPPRQGTTRPGAVLPASKGEQKAAAPKKSKYKKRK